VKNQTQVGQEGERLAAEFLVGKGFEIVVKNYRHRRAEIDLIVKRDDWLIFVEVKARSSMNYGHPEDFVGTQKISKLFEAAEEYIYATDWQGHVRFDVISVKLGTEPVIKHFEDAIN
jgi:putative endonuclease